MRKALNLTVTVLLLAMISAVVWLVFRPVPPQPVYQGQPLSYWLAAYDSYGQWPLGGARPTTDQADIAFRAMGTNALPTLVRMLHEPTSGLKDEFMQLLQKQHVIKIRYVPPVNWSCMSCSALQGMGPVTGNALPQLIAIFDRYHSAYPPAVIAEAGPAGQPAIPSLLRGLMNTNEIVRNNCIYALGCIHAEPGIVLPVLIKALNDPAALVRMQSAAALGKYGTNAVSAIPALEKLYHRELGNLRPGTYCGGGPYICLDWINAPIHAEGENWYVTGACKDALRLIDPASALSLDY